MKRFPASLALALLCATCCLASEVSAQADSYFTSLSSRTREPRFRPYRPNYFLFGSFNPDLEDRAFAGDSDEFPDGRNENVEVKFQFSFRYLVKDKGWLPPMYVAYTGTNYWQVYAWDESAPFRTTDHTPELFFEWLGEEPYFAYRFSPILHQSNGEGGDRSRSWNRAYGEVLWSTEPDLLAPRRFGQRLPQNAASAALRLWTVYDAEDLLLNDDITDYLGNFELRGELYPAWRGEHQIWGTLRDNLDFGGDHRSTIEMNWSFETPLLGPSLRLMFQYFYGYGESLLDYNVHSRRLSVGLELRG